MEIWLSDCASTGCDKGPCTGEDGCPDYSNRAAYSVEVVEGGAVVNGRTISPGESLLFERETGAPSWPYQYPLEIHRDKTPAENLDENERDEEGQLVPISRTVAYAPYSDYFSSPQYSGYTGWLCPVVLAVEFTVSAGDADGVYVINHSEGETTFVVSAGVIAYSSCTGGFSIDTPSSTPTFRRYQKAIANQGTDPYCTAPEDVPGRGWNCSTIAANTIFGEKTVEFSLLDSPGVLAFPAPPLHLIGAPRLSTAPASCGAWNTLDIYEGGHPETATLTIKAYPPKMDLSPLRWQVLTATETGEAMVIFGKDYTAIAAPGAADDAEMPASHTRFFDKITLSGKMEKLGTAEIGLTIDSACENPAP